jgi:hypothetical protein
MIGAAAATGQRHGDTGQKRLGSLTSAVGGLVVNRLVNGPRKEVRTLEVMGWVGLERVWMLG